MKAQMYEDYINEELFGMECKVVSVCHVTNRGYCEVGIEYLADKSGDTVKVYTDNLLAWMYSKIRS